MKTFNRPTASNRPARRAPKGSEIDQLAHRVRRLWVSGLWDKPDEHEVHTLALMDLELDLERLSLRLLADSFSVDDAAELDRCRNLIVALESEVAA